jgi:hypothetical protein
VKSVFANFSIGWDKARIGTDMAFTDSPVGVMLSNWLDRQQPGMYRGNAEGQRQLSLETMRKDYAGANLAEQSVTPVYQSRTANAVQGGFTSMAQAAPGIALSIALRNPAPAIGLAGGQIGFSAYGKYRERGATPGEAAIGGLAEGGIEAGTELLPMGTIVSKFGRTGATKFLTELLAKDMVGEQIATFTQDAVDTAIANPDKTWAQFLAERPGAAYDTAIAVLVMSGAIGAVHKVSRLGQEQVRAEQSAVAADTINQMHDLAAASKVRAREPATFQDFVRTATEDGPLENVWISADALQQALAPKAEGATGEASAPAVDPLAALPSLRGQLETALATGGEVAIPTDEFMNIAGTPLAQSLLPHLKADPAGMSQVQAKDFIANNGEKFKADVENVLKQEDTTDEYRQSAERVKQGFLDQFNSVNRFTPDVNDIYATTASAIYITSAKKRGMTPEQMLAEFPLHINAEGVMSPGALEQETAKPTLSTTMTPDEFLALTMPRRPRVRRRSRSQWTTSVGLWATTADTAPRAWPTPGTRTSRSRSSWPTGRPSPPGRRSGRNARARISCPTAPRR